MHFIEEKLEQTVIDMFAGVKVSETKRIKQVSPGVVFIPREI